jgi:hypothetical protein
MNPIVKATCSQEWHNSGGYKLSAYMGTYNEDPNFLSLSNTPVWIGGAKKNIFIFKSRGGRWLITTKRQSITEETGVLRTKLEHTESTSPPINVEWECWNSDYGAWLDNLWSEKGWVSMSEFSLY